MKEVKALIRPSKLDGVLEALQRIRDLPGCIVSHVHGYGRSTGRGTNTPLESADFVKLEIVVGERLLQNVLAAIQENAHTGNPGDGKIFVIECSDAVRIRTGKSGKAAL